MKRAADRLLIALAVAGVFGGLALAQPTGPGRTPAIKGPASAAAAPIVTEEAPPGPTQVPKAVESAPAAPEPIVAPPKIEAAPQAATPPPRPAAPASRARFPIAIVQVVDKITTETNRFEVRLDRPVQYKSLIFTLHACEATAPDESDRDYVAHMEVDFQPPAPDGRAKPARRSVFKGWMYASAPSVSPLEHPVYDAWLISCKSDAPPPVVAATPAPKPAAPKAAPKAAPPKPAPVE